MVRMCIVCKYRGDQIPRRSFHGVPPNAVQRKKWLDILGKRNDAVGSRAIICSHHFEENCFRYGLIYGRKLLKEGSLPSLNLNRQTVETPLPQESKNSYSTVQFKSSDEPREVPEIYQSCPEKTSMERLFANKNNCSTVQLEVGNKTWEVPLLKIKQPTPVETTMKRFFTNKSNCSTVEFKSGDDLCEVPVMKIEQSCPAEASMKMLLANKNICSTVRLEVGDRSCQVRVIKLKQPSPAEISVKTLFANKSNCSTDEFKSGDDLCEVPVMKIEPSTPAEISLERVDDIIRDPPISLNNSSASQSCVFESRRLLYLKERMGIQKKKITSLNREVRRLRRAKIAIKSQVKQLKKENAQHDRQTKLRNARLGPIPSALLSQLQSKKKKVSSYPLPLRVFASTMSFLSASAYKYLRSTFPSLPHAATLRKWYGAIDIKPGTCKTALDVLREKHEQANKIGKKLLCGVTVDGMAIRKLVTYNGKSYTGFVTYYNNDQVNVETRKQRSSIRATEAIVIMVVCLNEDWKIPVAYHFIDGLSSERRAQMVSESLDMLYPTGINVVSLTFDGGSSNIKMIESLGATFSYTDSFDLSFPHPATGEPIFVIFDASHSIQSVRNTLEEKKTLLDGCKDTIDWGYFEKLVACQNQHGLHCETRITKRHINFASEKFNIKLPTQLLSSGVSKALKFLRMTSKVPEFSNSFGTEKFCTVMNDIFNLLNSRQAFSKVPNKSAINRTNIEEIKSRVDEYENYIKSLNYDETPILSSDRGLGFYGLLVTLRSSISIFEKYALPNEALLEYLPTYKLSQDHLELFFSSVRSRGGKNSNNPTSEQFESALKWLLICVMDMPAVLNGVPNVASENERENVKIVNVTRGNERDGADG